MGVFKWVPHQKHIGIGIYLSQPSFHMGLFLHIDYLHITQPILCHHLYVTNHVGFQMVGIISETTLNHQLLHLSGLNMLTAFLHITKHIIVLEYTPYPSIHIIISPNDVRRMGAPHHSP